MLLRTAFDHEAGVEVVSVCFQHNIDSSRALRVCFFKHSTDRLQTQRHRLRHMARCEVEREVLLNSVQFWAECCRTSCGLHVLLPLHHILPALMLPSSVPSCCRNTLPLHSQTSTGAGSAVMLPYAGPAAPPRGAGVAVQ
jgi:hypothetical protein